MDELIKKSRDYAYRMRKDALRMSYAAGSHAAHFGAGMSIIDLLAVLYSNCMYLPLYGEKDWENRDRFILSKGHGVIGYYAALVEKGFILFEDMDSFESNNSYLLGHPVQNVKHGIEFTNGSLGMGLSIGIGVALGAKKDKKEFNTYVLLGDGECGEGAVWEAAIAASHFQLDHLCAIIDLNGLQLGGETKDVLNTDSLADKFTGFGWQVVEIDGHDHSEIYNAIRTPRHGKPLAIIAHTVKGKGFSFSENNNAWHHAVLTEKQYEEALLELEEAHDRD